MTPMKRIAVIAAILPLATAAQAEPEKVAVFDFQFAKGAPTPPTEDDKVRLQRTTEEFRSLLKDTGRYTLVPTDPVKQDVANTADLRACGAVPTPSARRLGPRGSSSGRCRRSPT